MADDTFIKVASAWKPIDKCYIKASAAWRTVDNIYVKTGGVWELVWVNGVFAAPSAEAVRSEVLSNGAGIDATLSVLDTGVVDWDADLGGTDEQFDWWTPNGTVDGTWHVRLEYVSGFLNWYSSGDGLNTWLPIDGTAPTWNFFENGYGSSGGSEVSTYSLKFSDDGGTSTHHTTTLTMTMAEPSI